MQAFCPRPPTPTPLGLPWEKTRWVGGRTCPHHASLTLSCLSLHEPETSAKQELGPHTVAKPSTTVGLPRGLLSFFFFLRPNPQSMEIPRLEVESELQLPAYATATATATQDPSRICDLHPSSWQHQILNPLMEARDRTGNLMDTS